MSLKVAQVLLSPRIGGAETLVSRLTMEWSSSQVESRTFYLDKGEVPGTRLRRILGLRRSLFEYRPDVIVSHSALPNMYARVAAPFGVPVIIVIHSAHNDYASGLIAAAERVLRFRTAAVVAVSRERLEEYQERFGETRPRGVVIANGIDANVEPKEYYRPHPISVVTVARTSPQKNPSLWAALTRTMPALEFTWHGPPSRSAAFDAIASAVREQPNAHFDGPSDRPLDVIRQADVLFHPADREAQSLVLIEAASVGVPVVCAEHIDRMLPLPVASATFAAGDPESARLALLDVISNYADICDRARARVVEVRARYSARITASDYLLEIRRALGSRSIIP